MDVIWKAKSWTNYFIKRKDEYSLHSPFTFELYNYLKKDFHTPDFDLIEQIRNKQLNNNNIIPAFDLGAGSQIKSSENLRVSDITVHAAIPSNYGKLLFKLIKKFAPNTILEIGTSTGISTLYLALASNAQVITVEGNPALVEIAKENFNKANCQNITTLTGDFSEQIPIAINKLNKIDFAFIDGNHKYHSTVNYYKLIKEKSHERTVLVFDDIHWSSEMEKAWQAIINDKDVTVSMDLFRLGIIIFKKELSKENYILKF